jgi:hypothetical protein
MKHTRTLLLRGGGGGRREGGAEGRFELILELDSI